MTLIFFLGLSPAYSSLYTSQDFKDELVDGFGSRLNEEVEVIGIAYAGNEERQEFGIPIILVEEIIQQLINGSFDYSFKANVEQIFGAGLYVYSADSNSPFRKVGINGGELITEIKGLSITDEASLKVYCDAMYTRSTDIGINFEGIDIAEFEKFNVEVSLDGNIATQKQRTSITTTTTTTTTTEKPTTTITTTTTIITTTTTTTFTTAATTTDTTKTT